MWNLHFKATAYKFTAIPETAASFACHYIHSAGKQAHEPSCNQVDLSKIHTGFGFLKWWQTYRKKRKS